MNTIIKCLKQNIYHFGTLLFLQSACSTFHAICKQFFFFPFIRLQLLDLCSFVPLLMIEMLKILHLTRIEYKKASNTTH